MVLPDCPYPRAGNEATHSGCQPERQPLIFVLTQQSPGARPGGPGGTARGWGEALGLRSPSALSPCGNSSRNHSNPGPIYLPASPTQPVGPSRQCHETCSLVPILRDKGKDSQRLIDVFKFTELNTSQIGPGLRATCPQHPASPGPGFELEPRDWFRPSHTAPHRPCSSLTTVQLP